MLACALLGLGAAVARGQSGPPPAHPATWQEQALSDELIDQAIARGLEFLRQTQHKQDGHWEQSSLENYRSEQADPKANKGDNSTLGIYGGTTSLVLLAMLKAGVSEKDPDFQRGLKFVLDIEPTQTYARALRGALLASLERPKDYARQAEADKNWLIKAMYSDGTFSYQPPPNRGAQIRPGNNARDLSNTQYGALGLWLLSDADFEVPIQCWTQIKNGYVKAQASDGGWGYGVANEQSGYQSMTLGALASLFIVWDHLYSRDVRCNPPRDPEMLKAMDRGLGWLAQNFQPDVNAGRTHWFKYYTLYGVERVGVASGLKYFGQANWWDQCARFVLFSQAEGGQWPSAAQLGSSEATSTAWALLFLAYGRAPVVLNKVSYGQPQQWNNRPRDVARLTGWMSKTYERHFNWQIMPIDRPLEELLDAPALLMSGQAGFELSGEQKDRLRDYVLGGGLLFGDAVHGGEGFAKSFRALAADLFPDLPMKPLPDDHAIFNVQFHVNASRPDAAPLPLEGVSNGVRLLVLLSPKDVGCPWQRWDIVSGRQCFELGANLTQYVSDRFSGLVNRGNSYLTRDRGVRPARQVTVGRVVWGERGQWDPEPAAWRRQDVLLRNAGVLGVATRPCDLSGPVPPRDVAVLHLTGVGPLVLTDAQKANLKRYVSDGGLLLADAAGGNRAFADSFHKQANELFGMLAPAAPDFLAGATDDGLVLLRHVEGLPRAKRPLPLLGRQVADGRWGVLFVTADLTAALAGYASVEPCGLTVPYADRFAAALLGHVAGVPGESPRAAAPPASVPQP